MSCPRNFKSRRAGRTIANVHMPTTFAQPSPRRHEPIVNRLEIGAICACSLIPNRRFLEPINPAIDKLGRLGAYRALLPPEAELDAQGKAAVRGAQQEGAVPDVRQEAAEPAAKRVEVAEPDAQREAAELDAQ